MASNDAIAAGLEYSKHMKIIRSELLDLHLKIVSKNESQLFENSYQCISVFIPAVVSLFDWHKNKLCF